MMLTLLILKLLQSPACHYMPQSDTSLIKEMSTLLLLYFSLHSTICHKSPSPWGILWQSALLHHNGNILLLTYLGVSLWLYSLLGSSSSLLGNHCGSVLNFCTWNMWYDSGFSLWKLGCSWNPTYFSSWTFPFQSGLLFPVGHTLLPLSGIPLNPRSDNFGRCVLLLHMNSMTWCRV